MAEPVVCPHCGAASSDADWCDACGAELQSLHLQDTLLEPGDTLSAPLPDPDAAGETVTLTLEIGEVGEQRPGRRSFLAKDAYGHPWRVEESNETASPADTLPEPMRALLDLPVAHVDHKGHRFALYRDRQHQTLAAWLDDRDEPLDPEQALAWLRPLFGLLTSLHDAGYACLQVSPHTLVRSADGELALYEVEKLYPIDQELTRVPLFPGFTAPEIYHARSGDHPGRGADLFMAGMLMFTFVTGRRPPTDPVSNFLPLLRPRDFVPTLPLGFSALLGKLCAPAPADRPQSAAEFLAALESAIEQSRPAPAPDAPPKLAIAAERHIGIVKRMHMPVNQDNVYFASNPEADQHLLLVADGVSTATYGTGDKASGLVLETFKQAWSKDFSGDNGSAPQSESWLRATLDAANQAILDAVNESDASFGREPEGVMGSTCVAAVIHKGHCTLVSLGDSRAYLWREGWLERITRDHNVRTWGMIQGAPADLALRHPQAEAITHCLGVGDVQEGHLVSKELHPDVFEFNLQAGDRLLLCTDGVTDFVGADEASREALLKQVISLAPLPDLACLDLIHLANHGGGGDNIGCTIAFVEPPFANATEWFLRGGTVDSAAPEPESTEPGSTEPGLAES